MWRRERLFRRQIESLRGLYRECRLDMPGLLPRLPAVVSLLLVRYTSPYAYWSNHAGLRLQHISRLTGAEHFACVVRLPDLMEQGSDAVELLEVCRDRDVSPEAKCGTDTICPHHSAWLAQSVPKPIAQWKRLTIENAATTPRRHLTSSC